MKSNSHACKQHLNLHSNALNRRTKDSMQRWANVMCWWRDEVSSVRVDFLVSIKRHWRGKTAQQQHTAYWMWPSFTGYSCCFEVNLLHFSSMAYSSDWHGWKKYSNFLLLIRGALSLLARDSVTDTKWWTDLAPPLASSLRRNLLRKISKVQSGRTSGIVCSHNGKRGLVGNVRIATKRRGGNECGSRNKSEERPSNWRLPIWEKQSIVTKDV